jgi:endonuclease/exonuclease/phosphatase family metal-dependent hydrolase
LTIGALADQPLDVACLQEVWLEEDVDALLAATRARWPNTIVPAPQPRALPGTDPACRAEELVPLTTCVASTCTGFPGDELAGCAIAECQTELFELPDSCSTCLATNVGATFEDIQRTCTTTPGPEFAFDGSFGLALVSRLPLLERDVLVLESSLNRRAVIYARVEAEDVAAHVFCTHLTPIFDDLPFPGDGSFEAEQRAQIEALIDFIDSKTTPEDRVVLVGDLNTGPGFGDIAPEAEANYNILLTRFRNPYVEELDNPLCTFCADNPLVADDADSVIIDHVLVRNLDADGTATRILTGEVDIDVGGTPTTVALSDHYGVLAALIE